MATRTIWQDVYAGAIDEISAGSLSTHMLRTFDGTASTDFFRATESSGSAADADIGIQGLAAGAVQKFGLPLTDHPNFKAPSASLDTEQARGIASRHTGEFDTVQAGDPVEFNLPMLGNAYNVSMFSKLLFQGGCTTGAAGSGLQLQTATEYDSADPIVFGAFCRFMQAAGAGGTIDNVVQGAVCSSLAMSGEAGNVLTIEPTIRGAKWSQANTASMVTGAATFDDANNLKYQDCVVAIQHNGSAWVEVFSPAISVTVTNNAGFTFYNDDQANACILGRLAVEGTISIPFSNAAVGQNWAIDRFLAGDVRKIAWYWGDSGGAFDPGTDFNLGDEIDRYKNDSSPTAHKNYVSVLINAQITDYEVAGDNELMIEASFQGVSDGTTNAITVYSQYDDAKLNRA